MNKKHHKRGLASLTLHTNRLPAESLKHRGPICIRKYFLSLQTTTHQLCYKPLKCGVPVKTDIRETRLEHSRIPSDVEQRCLRLERSRLSCPPSAPSSPTTASWAAPPRGKREGLKSSNGNNQQPSHEAERVPGAVSPARRLAFNYVFAGFLHVPSWVSAFASHIVPVYDML